MRLIDKRELMELLDDMFSRYDGTPSVMEGFKYGLDAVISEVSVMPTIDAEPIKHGKWEHGRELSRDFVGRELVAIDYEDYHCSVCGAKYKNKDTIIAFKFCPICGTHMEGVEE